MALLRRLRAVTPVQLEWVLSRAPAEVRPNMEAKINEMAELGAQMRNGMGMGMGMGLEGGLFGGAGQEGGEGAEEEEDGEESEWEEV